MYLRYVCVSVCLYNEIIVIPFNFKFKYNLRMDLKKYFDSDPRGAKAEMAEHLGITPTWISLLISGKRLASPKLAIAIELATGSLVTRQNLRPDLFGAPSK